MAKKSKAQRARASARRAEKKERARIAEEQELSAPAPEPEKEKGKVVSFLESTPLKKTDEQKAEAAQQRKEDAERDERERAEAKKKKPARFQGLRNVRAEMKRVTWPTRQDVTRWSLVVIGALVFFTLYVTVLDNFVVTPLLYFISGFAPTA